MMNQSTVLLRTLSGESNIVAGVMKEDYLVEFVGKEFECADAGMRPNEKVES